MCTQFREWVLFDRQCGKAFSAEAACGPIQRRRIPFFKLEAPASIFTCRYITKSGLTTVWATMSGKSACQLLHFACALVFIHLSPLGKFIHCTMAARAYSSVILARSPARCSDSRLFCHSRLINRLHTLAMGVRICFYCVNTLFYHRFWCDCKAQV